MFSSLSHLIYLTFLESHKFITCFYSSHIPPLAPNSTALYVVVIVVPWLTSLELQQNIPSWFYSRCTIAPENMRGEKLHVGHRRKQFDEASSCKFWYWKSRDIQNISKRNLITWGPLSIQPFNVYILGTDCIVLFPAKFVFDMCSGSIMVTTLDCGPGGLWFKSQVGTNNGPISYTICL